jgi:hypothetical protein
MSSSSGKGRGELTPDVSFMQSTVKSIVKALSGRTQAPRPEASSGPPAGERNATENWAHFAEEVLRLEDAMEESTTGPPEILLPSGTGFVETSLSKGLVGEGTSRLREVRSFSPGLVPPDPELLSVPARRSLSEVFGASGIRLTSDGFDPPWNREILRPASAG